MQAKHPFVRTHVPNFRGAVSPTPAACCPFEIICVPAVTRRRLIPIWFRWICSVSVTDTRNNGEYLEGLVAIMSVLHLNRSVKRGKTRRTYGAKRLLHEYLLRVIFYFKKCKLFKVRKKQQTFFQKKFKCFSYTLFIQLYRYRISLRVLLQHS